MPSSIQLGKRDVDELNRVSRCLHHYRAADCTVNTVDGVVGTHTRSTTAGLTDNYGAGFLHGNHIPIFENYIDGYAGNANGFGRGALIKANYLRIPSTDRLYFDVGWRPQAFGFYLEFFTGVSSGTQALLSITNDSASGARFVLEWATTHYRLRHHNGSTEVTVMLSGTTPVAGNRCYLWGYLYSDGSIQLWQSVNEGTATNTARSIANTLNSAWASGAKLRYSSLGTASGSDAYHRVVKLVPGLPSLAQMLRAF